jgi:hypothetical protein
MTSRIGVINRIYMKAYYLSHRKEAKAYNLAHREETKTWRLANADKIKKDRKAYHLAHKEESAASLKLYRKTHPLVSIAGKVISRRVKRGAIFRPGVCSLCGLTARIEGHHPDYTKPEEVVWLCKSCHRKERIT